jgi:hypothetical protein
MQQLKQLVEGVRPQRIAAKAREGSLAIRGRNLRSEEEHNLERKDTAHDGRYQQYTLPNSSMSRDCQEICEHLQRDGVLR